MDGSLESGPRVSFKVEKIIGVSSDGNLRTYQVQWAPAWVSGCHLVGCENLIQEFLCKQLGKENENERTQSDEPCSISESGEASVPQSSSDSYATNDLAGNIDILQQYEKAPAEYDSLTANDEISSDFDGGEYQPQGNNKNGIDFAPAVSYVKIEIDDDDENTDIVSDQPYQPQIQQNSEGSESYMVNNNHPSTSSWSASEEHLMQSRESTHDSETDTPHSKVTTNSNQVAVFQHQSNSVTNTCPICFKCFSTERRLAMHVHTHNNGNKPYTCEHCQKSFSRSHHLKDHLRIHTGSKPYTCDLCDKKFAVRSNLKTHRKTKHNLTPYSCELCGLPFTRKVQLKEHMAEVHGDMVGEVT